MKRRWSSKLVIVKNATQGLFVAETPEMHDLRQRRCPINQRRPNLQRRLHDHCLNRRHGFHHQIPVAFACGFESDSAKNLASFGNLIIFYREGPWLTLRVEFLAPSHHGGSSRHSATVRFWIMVRAATQWRRRARSSNTFHSSASRNPVECSGWK